MELQIRQIVFDAADLEVVADFWSELLGWPITFRSDDWVSMSGSASGLAVQRVAEHIKPDWPDPEQPQQVHLDIPVPDIDAYEELVLRLGGEKLSEHPEQDPPFRVYADPAGHSFCLEYGAAVEGPSG